MAMSTQSEYQKMDLPLGIYGPEIVTSGLKAVVSLIPGEEEAAEFIVCACNTHYEALDALKAARAFMEGHQSWASVLMVQNAIESLEGE